MGCLYFHDLPFLTKNILQINLSHPVSFFFWGNLRCILRLNYNIFVKFWYFSCLLTAVLYWTSVVCYFYVGYSGFLLNMWFIHSCVHSKQTHPQTNKPGGPYMLITTICCNIFRGLEYENSLMGKQPTVESENKAKYVAATILKWNLCNKTMV